MLDGNEDDKIEGSSLGGSPGSDLRTEIGSSEGMLDEKEYEDIGG